MFFQFYMKDTGYCMLVVRDNIIWAKMGLIYLAHPCGSQLSLVLTLVSLIFL